MSYLNQVMLVGSVEEIFNDSFIVNIADTKDNIKISEVPEEVIAQLLLNNKVGVKGHCVECDNQSIKIVYDKVVILDARGKNNE